MSENGDALAAKAATPGAPRHVQALRPRIPFGEELPVFCERCGYSFNGLPQIRCDACQVLHFSCPECNHHQPINTLRPAFQRVLGRLRALGLALIVFLKIMFFGWILFFWGIGGAEISYRYDRYGPASGYALIPTHFESEGGVVLCLFGMGFGMVGRMLLLRWRRGVIIGLVLGALVVLAMSLGAEMRDLGDSRSLPSPFEVGFNLFAMVLRRHLERMRDGVGHLAVPRAYVSA
jgi:hypothetical protein